MLDDKMYLLKRIVGLYQESADHAGVMPHTFQHGVRDIGAQRKQLREIIFSCWPACSAADPEHPDMPFTVSQNVWLSTWGIWDRLSGCSLGILKDSEGAKAERDVQARVTVMLIPQNKSAHVSSRRQGLICCIYSVRASVHSVSSWGMTRMLGSLLRAPPQQVDMPCITREGEVRREGGTQQKGREIARKGGRGRDLLRSFSCQWPMRNNNMASCLGHFTEGRPHR